MKRLLLLALCCLCSPGMRLCGATQPAPAPREEAAQLDAAGGTLYGTLLLPATDGPWPVALIVAGSGPTDRDGNNPLGVRARSYALLADSLAARGIATLRYDKRGIAASAASGGEESTLRFEHYIDDAAAWAAKLAADPRFSRIVLAGHSEGALIALAAAQNCSCDGVVTLAGAAVSMDVILRRQLGRLPTRLMIEANAIIGSLKAGVRVEAMSPQLSALFRPSVQPFLISQMRYDPASLARSLAAPLLVVQGTSDIQISEQNGEQLAAAAPDARLVVVQGMNHVLKACPTTDPAAQMAVYADPTLPLCEGLVLAIAEFVQALP